MEFRVFKMNVWTKLILCVVSICQFQIFTSGASPNTLVNYINTAKCSHSPGADLTRGVNSNGRCICKRNVRGSNCSKCKRNSFHFSASQPEGCLRCFCSGRSKSCTSSQLKREKVEYTFNEHNQGFELVLRNLSLVNGLPKIDETNQQIFITQLPVDSKETYYWKLPNAFLGDKLTSYGGNISFDLSYAVPATERSRWNKEPIIIIKGNGMTVHYKEVLKERTTSIQSLQLDEELWYKAKAKRRRPPRRVDSHSRMKKRKRKRKPLKRKHMMSVLANVEYILIKANYRRHADEVRLRSVSINLASEDGNLSTIAEEVEQCDCPPEYSGLSCQHCSSGYTKQLSDKKDGSSTFTCIPCQCNGQSNTCHPDTGECFGCQNGTSGDRCQRPRDFCDERGKMYRGDSDCICKPRVLGESCDTCKRGFFHLSINNEQGCKTCWCNGVTSLCESSRLFHSKIRLSADSYMSIALLLGDGTKILSPIPLNNGTAKFKRSSFQMMNWSLPKKFTGNLLKSYGGLLEFTVYNSGFCFPQEDSRLIVELVDFQDRHFQWKFKEMIELNEPSTFYIPLLEEQFLYMNSPIQRNYFMRLLSFVKEITISVPRCSRIQYTSIREIALTTAVTQDTGDSRAVEVERCYCPAQYSGFSCENCAPGYVKDPFSKRCRRKAGMRP